MKIKDLRATCISNFWVLGLFSVKRIWGPDASISIVQTGIEFKTYRTVAELISDNLVPNGYEWIDELFPNMPTISECPFEDAEIVEGNSDCPWVVARIEQERARVRADFARERAKEKDYTENLRRYC